MTNNNITVQSDDLYTPIKEIEIPKDWIRIDDEGYFICPECENKVQPNISSEEGIVPANLADIFEDLEKYPNKIIYAICPVCGMEYEFKKIGGVLYLKPSALEK